MRPGARRDFLAATAALTAAGPVAALSLGPAVSAPKVAIARGGVPATIAGGFADRAMARGHRLRDATAATAGAASPPAGSPSAAASPAAAGTAPAVPSTRCSVLIVGAGIAGLAAARALRARGVDDYRIVELDDAIGGNSRASALDGLPCPAGAHYLPLPGEAAHEVRDLLTELGVRDAAGRYDERMLCHSPQERLFIHGVWQDGLLPVVAQSAATFDAYRRFADRVESLRQRHAFALPVARGAAPRSIGNLAGVRFGDWLAAEGLQAEALRWYLDYCCRDDYGAGLDTVSAWAGLHYFASRHGFALPEAVIGDRRDAERAGGARSGGGEGLLTWPEGNGWLAERLAAPHRSRIHTGVTVRRIAHQQAGAAGAGAGHLRIDAEVGDGDGAVRAVHWLADWVVWAAPSFVAARVIADDGADVTAFRQAAARIRYAAWAVANLAIAPAWQDPSVERIAWDNVLYGSAALGYVDARHQRLDRKGGPRLWTWYRALGPTPAARAALAARPWRDWVAEIAADLGRAHPTLAPHLQRVEVHRWGHAMAAPTPELIGSGALDVLRRPVGRIYPANSDLAGYSVFEEAVYWGSRAGGAVAERLGRG
ncbi:MAG: FAD-dependent oxidoreductase [Lautropia sp.]